jgi:hypothetical protein
LNLFIIAEALNAYVTIGAGSRFTEMGASPSAAVFFAKRKPALSEPEQGEGESNEHLACGATMPSSIPEGLSGG